MTAFLLSQAFAAHQSGRLDEAEKLYRAALAENPKAADALALLGTILSTRGAHAEALNLIHQALLLDPKAALFHFYHGNALCAAGRAGEAIGAFHRATLLDPRLVEAFYNLGNALRLVGRADEALGFYARTLQIDETHTLARNNLAILLGEKDHPDLAVAQLEDVVRRAPTFVEGWINLCNYAERAGAYGTAYRAGLQAVARAPQNTNGWLGLGVALNKLGRNEEAAAAYHAALLLAPERADIWDNLGQTYQFMNCLPEAETAYRKTIVCDGQSLDDDAVLACDETLLKNRHWHLALLELLKGDLLHGFARYRARFDEVGGLTRPAFKQPLWRGADLTGQTLLVMDEQGHGDALMMARFLPLLKQRGARVIFYVQPALAPLFKGWRGVEAVVARGDPLPDFDAYASIFDLPYGLGVTLDTIPAAPYLPVPASDDQALLPQGFKIGVAWAGAPTHKHDARRSLPLALFARLFADKAATFYALVKDKRDGDDAFLALHANVVDLAPRLHDFADTARFVAQMDLIVTCDTSLAHLAGGMGKSVWTLLPFAPDWRWLLNRTDSPWYSSMRLFRQPLSGDWESVIAKVQGALGTDG